MRVKLLGGGGGGSPINGAPPPVIFFCLLVWETCYIVGTTCNDRWSLRNTFTWMEAQQAPQQFNGRVLVEVQGARHLEAPKNLHLTIPKSRSIIAQQYVDGCAFFHVHSSTKSQENHKGSKFSILKFLIRKKCVCSIVSAEQSFSNLKGKQLKSHRSVPRSTVHCATSE